MDEIIRDLRTHNGVDVYALNEGMLSKTIELAETDLELRPFDQAILGAVLGRADELREQGQTDLCFCGMDADLQPWDKRGNPKRSLTDLYDRAGVWVYGDFSLTWPERPRKWSNAGHDSECDRDELTITTGRRASRACVGREAYTTGAAALYRVGKRRPAAQIGSPENGAGHKAMPDYSIHRASDLVGDERLIVETAGYRSPGP